LVRLIPAEAQTLYLDRGKYSSAEFGSLYFPEEVFRNQIREDIQVFPRALRK